MDEWGCVDRWIDGWVDAQMDTWMDRCLKKSSVRLPQAGCIPETREWPGLLLFPSTHRDDDICDSLVGHLAVPKHPDVEGADLQRGSHM